MKLRKQYKKINKAKFWAVQHTDRKHKKEPKRVFGV